MIKKKKNDQTFLPTHPMEMLSTGDYNHIVLINKADIIITIINIAFILKHWKLTRGCQIQVSNLSENQCLSSKK